ncbi:MAG: beta-glucosidase BglX [Cyclobacteriaceae bacterium]
MKRFLASVLLITGIAAHAQVNVESQIDSILAIMSIEEKAGQLVQINGSWDVTGPAPTGGSNEQKYNNIKSGLVGSMLNVVTVDGTRKMQELALQSRLGIPLIFGYDVIHGYQTMLPIPLGETASWDPEVMRKGAALAAKEASAAGLHWTFAPMIDISRDARWGRVMEGAGEDPYLNTIAAVARVEGFQGNDLAASSTVAACAKHFAGYGFVESGREYSAVDMSKQVLHNVVLPPFKAAVDAGIASVMNSFNETNGIPATGDSYLQRDLLKGEWDFQGMVVSDWGSIGEMISHGFAENSKHAAAIALRAGSDMDMESNCYETLAEQVNNGILSEALLDDAVRRVLRLKFKLGLFDDPFKYCDPKREVSDIGSEENLVIARDAARKSIVLLKNENNILPLPKTGKSIAVIGALAADKDVPLGNWRAKAISGSAVSLLEGLKAVNGNVKYAEGYKLSVGERNFLRELTYEMEDRSGFQEAIDLAKSTDIVVMAMGEDCWQTGEGRSQTDIRLKGLQEELLMEIVKVNKNVVVVLMNGRPVAIPEIAATSQGLVEAWHLGSEAGNGIADVLFGDYNPSGKLPMTFPRNTGQSPIFYAKKNTGRPYSDGSDNPVVFWSHYTDSPNTPLFHFGFGLSYTSFEYSNLALSKDVFSEGELIEVSVDITNTGGMDGEEVAQLYIHDVVGSITRPVKELKGFDKLMIKSGETRTVSFTIDQETIKFYGPEDKWISEPGKFEVFVGGSSVDLLRSEFHYK